MPLPIKKATPLAPPAPPNPRSMASSPRNHASLSSRFPDLSPGFRRSLPKTFAMAVVAVLPPGAILRLAAADALIFNGGEVAASIEVAKEKWEMHRKVWVADIPILAGLRDYQVRGANPVTYLIMSLLPNSESILIREVWGDNLEEEFNLIREIVDNYPLVAMDTEFPGIVIRPVGNFKSNNEYHYQTLKDNVDALKLIQLGLTLSDGEGNLPRCQLSGRHCIWQFNFREFDLERDLYAMESIELLRHSGINFLKNNQRGIDVRSFGELLMSSGVVLNQNVHWVTFHSGYDFGYLLKLLTCNKLPQSQPEFFELISTYFPTLYDIKHLMKFCNSLHGGLNKLAELLEVERVGVCHQAGSDSLLTSCAFIKLKQNFFTGSMAKYAGVLYGLGAEYEYAF